MDKDIFFDNCEFVLEYGASILYQYKLKITNSQLHGCEYMWEGLRSDVGAELYMDNVMIQDAYKACTITGFPVKGARFQMYNSLFNNNLVGAEIRNLIGNTMKIQNCIFTSRQIATAQSSFPSVNQLKANNESQLLAASEISLKPPMADIGRGYCGIFTHQMLGLWIDGGSTASNYNLFDHLSFGIISFMARTKVTNCHFQNLAFAAGKPDFPMDYLPNPGLYNSATLVNRGVGIAADGISAPDFWLYVGDGTSLKINSFKNCASAGISISGLREKRILLNNFDGDEGIQGPYGGNYGIKIMNDNFGAGPTFAMKTHIISNHIKNTKHSIAIYQAGVDYNFADLKIYYNLLDGTPGTGIELAATNTNFYPSTSSNNYPIDKTIFSNTILNTKTGMKLSNIKVVPGSSNTHLYINNNTINLSSLKTTTSASTGIDISSCKYIDVINNADISGSYTLPLSTPYHKAIKHTNSPYCMVSCNVVNDVDQAYVFEGACLPTAFTNNYMSDCYDGVVLNYSGIIGDQGSESRPSDNYWNPNPGSFGNYKTSVYNGSVIPFSTFFVRQVSGYAHPIAQDYALVFQNRVNFLPANGALITCSTNNNSSLNGEQDEMERLVADSSTQEIDEERIFLWKKLIYDKMSNDSLFADTASLALRNYYTELTNQNVGTLAESERLIQDREYLQAQLLADAVVSGNTSESILRSILITYCNWLLDSEYVFSLAELESLSQIASYCPAIYGDAVGIARNLLKIAGNIETDYEDNCAPENSSRRARDNKKEKDDSIGSNELTLGPNPSKGLIYMHGLDDASAVLNLLNNQGQIVLKKMFSKDEDTIDLGNLPNGMYAYQLVTKSGQTITSKLVLIHD